MDRQPVRIHPDVTAKETRIVTFRDGPRLVPDYLLEFVTVDAHPDLTFQEWVNSTANKKMESRVVDRALGLMRLSHLV